jgi:broad specificity phosphatase PhoE
MKSIYFIRHGEGYHNLNNYSLLYPRLTEKGLQQCAELKTKLQDINFDKIYVSPLIRTIETALNSFSENNNFISVDYIREVIKNNCDYCGSIQEKRDNFNNIEFCIDEINNNLESDEDVEIRLDKLFNLINQEIYENIAIVSHGEFIFRFIYKYGDLLDIENKDFFNNCEYRVGLLKNLKNNYSK